MDKNFNRVFFLVGCLIILISSITYSRADSGWDSSYSDSSSYSGSSYSDYSSSYSNSSYSGSSSYSSSHSDSIYSMPGYDYEEKVIDAVGAKTAYANRIFFISVVLVQTMIVGNMLLKVKPLKPKKIEFDKCEEVEKDTLTVLINSLNARGIHGIKKPLEFYTTEVIDDNNYIFVAIFDQHNPFIITVYKDEEKGKYRISKIVGTQVNPDINSTFTLFFIALFGWIFLSTVVNELLLAKQVALAFIIPVFFSIILILLAYKKTKEDQKETDIKIKNTEYKFMQDTSNKQNIMSEEELKSLDINKDELINLAFNIYKDVQIAWMNFDYKKLNSLLTNELYNQYKMQLETLKKEKGKNIMKNICFLGGEIESVIRNDNTETIKVLLQVSQKDYVINTETKEVIHGNINKVFKNDYIITLERSLKDKEMKCPNCGQIIKDEEKCPSCSSVIVHNSNKYVMSKKTLIIQR